MYPLLDVKLAAKRLMTGVTLQFAERGAPTGEAIVFLHGYTDSWFSFSRVLPLLPHEYRALALTLRGHGDSEKPDCCYAIDDFVADVVAFLDACEIGQATIVGMSGGSFIAQLAALDYPQRVSRLVLISSAPTLQGNEAVAGLGHEMLRLEDPITPQFVTEWQQVNLYRPVPDDFFETVVSESLKLPARVWRNFWKGVVLAPDHSSRLGEISVPTLVLWGEQDAVFSRDDPTQLAAAIPNATLKVYPETGHSVHWERPEEVVRDLVAFMKATPPDLQDEATAI
ncbi:MAG: alpha/beta hydrolase [Mycetocola sp.]